MRTHAVASIEDAVALAERWRAEGRHDLFRGQRRDWPVVATLARLGAEPQAAAERRMKRFFGWLQQQPELQALADRENPGLVDQKFAIAQHYGLPTLFCDFSSEPRVAGFFASEEAEAQPGETSVIVCCNSRHFEAWSRKAFGPRGPRPSVLRMSVPNLWRLEAQAGAFLFLPLADVEAHYAFERIRFPAGRFDGIAAEDIYPLRRSRLEVLMDQYFRHEHEAERYAKVALTPGVSLTVVPQAAAMMQDTLRAGDPGPHPSWTAAPAAWRAHPVEPWRPGRDTQRLHLCDDLRAAPAAVGAEVRRAVERFLAERADARRVAVTLESGSPELAGLLQRAQLLWDGLRPLPCTDAQLALAMSTLCRLGASLLRMSGSDAAGRLIERVAGELWTEPLELEFGRAGAPACGFADREALQRALRPDLASLLKPEHRALAGHPLDAVNAVPVPSRAFAFEPFASVFVTQIVPSQVILFRSKAHYFSPLELETFGNP